ncbi:MAG: acyltransferase family protein [Microthrixaceae bacterium]
MSSLDGLRALAVVGVIVYHAEPDLLPGGFLGVDVFFVISGYLITSLLLRERSSQGYIDLRRFWRRRIRRLGPALLAVMAVVAILGRFWLPTDQLGSLRADELASLGYVMNWRLIVTGDSYFNTFAPSPLRHVWSLSVEEQFYLVWPVVAAFAMARSRLMMAKVAAVAFTASVVAMALVGGGLSRVYYGTDTRLHVIMAGCLLAVLESERGDLVRRLGASKPLVFIATALLGVAMVFVAEDHEAFFPAGLVVFSAITVVSVAGCATHRSLPVLSSRALVGIGRRSYGLYLWHWPVMVFLTDDRLGVAHVPGTIVRVLVFSSLTWASYAFLEHPILTRRVPLPRWWPAAPVGVVVVAMVATLGATSNEFQLTKDGRVGTVEAALGVDAPVGSDGEPINSLLIVGDSVAMSLHDELSEELASQGVQSATAAIVGCGILEGTEVTESGDEAEFAAGCPPNLASQDQLIAENDPDVVLVIAQVDSFPRELADGTVLDFESSPEEYLDLLNDAVDRLTVGDATVAIALPANMVLYDDKGKNAKLGEWRRLLRRLDDRRDDVVLVDLQSLICPDGECIRERDGVELRPDGLHYTEESSTLIAPQIIQALYTALRAD